MPRFFFYHLLFAFFTAAVAATFADAVATATATVAA